MADAALAAATALLHTLPPFASLDPARLTITRLGGLTNLVFRVGQEGGDSSRQQAWCLRLPGEGTEDIINRAFEKNAALETARVGVSPDVLYFDDKTGIMVARFLDGAVTMSPTFFKERHHAPKRAGAILCKLHSSGAVFDNTFNVFAMVDEYLKVLAKKQLEIMPDGFDEAVRVANQSVRAALDAHPLPSVACHCDPLSENFMDEDGGGRMWLVDWEYSGMNDPLWDVADLAVEAELDSAHEDELLQGYFGVAVKEIHAFDRGRVVLYKALCDLLWTLWGLIQHANGNPAEDFYAYACNRFSRCSVLMAAPAFAGHVQAVAAGPGPLEAGTVAEDNSAGTQSSNSLFGNHQMASSEGAITITSWPDFGSAAYYPAKVPPPPPLPPPM
jgi:thiamine kinase-like enzyme